MGNSYEIVKSMKPLPFGKDEFLLLIGAIVLPLLPLVLTMFSMETLIRKLLHMIL
jgi:hypothetical protein